MTDTQTLESLRRRFAGRERAIERAYRASESFRGLCRDYLACANALVRWQESSLAEAPSRVQEYSGLLAELTDEIQSRLRAEERLARSPSQGEVGPS